MKSAVQEDLTRKFNEIIKNLPEDEVSHLFNELSLTLNVKQNRPKLPPNIMVFQTVAYLCATKLKPASNKILMYFFSISMYENVISMDIKTLMEDLLLSKPTVISSINELAEHGIITRVKYITDKRRNEYMLNPFASWKGNSTARNILIGKMAKDVDSNQLSLFGEQIEESLHRENLEIRNKKHVQSIEGLKMIEIE